MRALSILFLLFLISSVHAQSVPATTESNDDDRSDWEMNDYWEDTRLDFKNLIYGTLNRSSCSAGVKELLGCVAAVNKMRQLQYPQERMMIKLDLENNSSFMEEDFSSLSKEEYHAEYESYLISLKDELEKIEDALSLLAPDIEGQVSRFEQKHVNEANDSMLAGELYNEYLRVAVDPHTYLIPRSYMEDSSRPSVSKKGIGIYFNLIDHESRSKYLISDVIENSPAQKSGIMPGDIVLSANKAEVQAEVLDVIKNADPIEFVMLRNNSLVEVFLQKGRYTVKQVQGSVLSQKGKKYGYIKLRTFSDRTACSKMKNLAANMIEKENIEGFILDLRNNGGGLVNQAKCIMGMYLEPFSTSWAVRYLESENQDTIVTEKLYRGEQEFKDLHTTTLINGYSASASEALAMYLSDYRKSFIVGERTFGKGSMQTVIGYDKNKKVLNGKTVALYYGPKGISPQVRGVEPEFKVYPKIDQAEPTPFKREADRYTFPIEDKAVNPSLYLDQDRIKDLEAIDVCLEQESDKQRRYEELGPSEKLLFDNQLETAMEVLNCANKNVEIHRGLELKQVESYTYKSKWSLMGELLDKAKKDLEIPKINFNDPKWKPVKIPAPALPKAPLPKN